MQRVEKTFLKQPLKDWKSKKALSKHYDDLIEGHCLITEGGVPKVLVAPFHADEEKSIAALKSISYITDMRTLGLKTVSRTFGFLPRNTIRRDFCTHCSANREHCKEIDFFMSLAPECEAVFAEYFPKQHLKQRETIMNSVLDEWRMPGTIYTSGIINKNNPIEYHIDGGNFKDTMSAMLVYKKGVTGGYLVLPEARTALAIPNSSIVIFNGADVLHGVTQIVKRSPSAYRYSIVYYGLQQMRHCLPPQEELERIRKVKTEREIKRRNRN